MDINWALEEPAFVTIVGLHPTQLLFLRQLDEVPFTRHGTKPNDAFVMTFEDGRILVNGEYQDVDDNMMAWCAIADEAVFFGGVGFCYTSDQFRD